MNNSYFYDAARPPIPLPWGLASGASNGDFDKLPNEVIIRILDHLPRHGDVPGSLRTLFWFGRTSRSLNSLVKGELPRLITKCLEGGSDLNPAIPPSIFKGLVKEAAENLTKIKVSQPGELYFLSLLQNELKKLKEIDIGTINFLSCVDKLHRMLPILDKVDIVKSSEALFLRKSPTEGPVAILKKAHILTDQLLAEMRDLFFNGALGNDLPEGSEKQYTNQDVWKYLKPTFPFDYSLYISNIQDFLASSNSKPIDRLFLKGTQQVIHSTQTLNSLADCFEMTLLKELTLPVYATGTSIVAIFRDKQFSKLQLLGIPNHVAHGEVMQHIVAACPNLTTLFLYQQPKKEGGNTAAPVNELDDEAMQLLTRLPLKRIKIEGPLRRINRAVYNGLGRLADRLEELTLSEGALNNRTIHYWLCRNISFPKVRVLRIMQNPSLKPTNLQHLHRLFPQMTTLDISDHPNWSYRTLGYFLDCKQLQHINCAETAVTDKEAEKFVNYMRWNNALVSTNKNIEEGRYF